MGSGPRLRAPGFEYSDAAWHVVDSSLEKRASALAVAYRQTCEATHVRREQSGELMEMRMSCLRARLEETRAYVAILAEGDRDVVAPAAVAVHDLTPIEDCADLASLTSMVKPTRASYATVDRIQSVLAEARALHVAGRPRRRSPSPSQPSPTRARSGIARSRPKLWFCNRSCRVSPATMQPKNRRCTKRCEQRSPDSTTARRQSLDHAGRRRR